MECLRELGRVEVNSRDAHLFRELEIVKESKIARKQNKKKFHKKQRKDRSFYFPSSIIYFTTDVCFPLTECNVTVVLEVGPRPTASGLASASPTTSTSSGMTGPETGRNIRRIYGWQPDATTFISPLHNSLDKINKRCLKKF